jgi:peptidoglycan/xylan/chitin deacetylase (PgdA/CDA1 family)
MTTPENEDSIDLVVFTGAPGHSIYKTVSKLLDLPFKLNIHILIHRPPRRFKRLAKNQVSNIKRHGWRWIPYQAAEILSSPKRKFISTQNSLDSTGQNYTLKRLLDTGKVHIEEFESVNSESAQAYLVAILDLRLGLSLAAPILKAGTFEVPKLGTINLHKGKLPEYRGMPPAFWELLANEKEVGVSIHFVEKGLDTGALINTGTVPIERFSSPAGLRVALDECGHDLVCQSVTEILKRNCVSQPQEGVGKTNSRPTLEAEWGMARSVSRKEGAYGARRLLKNIIFSSYSATRRVGSRLNVLKPTISVLLYHRVSDAFRDGVTIGVEQFDKQLEFLKNNYDVRSLRSLVNGDESIDGNHDIVCITFDDGYLDNYTNAAPLLVKHGLSATFFVSTDNVTNQTPFKHDLDKLGFGLACMTWDNIRQMAEDGLDFGSHTVNHANLASIADDKILEELVESKRTIEKELQSDEVLFAYPFGQRHHFTERSRDLVKEVGYTCCCSAFGGQNIKNEWDPFSIKRIGISYNFSMAALRANLHGWSKA